MQEANIIDSIRSFILTCPFLDNYRVNVDHLSEDRVILLIPLPCDPVLQNTLMVAKETVSICFYMQGAV